MRRLNLLKRVLQALLIFVLAILLVAWVRSPNPSHLANLAWAIFLLFTVMLLGRWWGNRIAIKTFVSVVALVGIWVLIEAYAYTQISKEVHSCFSAELTALRTSGKTQFTTPEMREILNRSVTCAKKRIGPFEAFFWKNERAMNTIKIASPK